jgi:NADPH:quinone reductase-like Zn-dependent oxidoreductase
VLIHAAAVSVGQGAIMIAQHTGAEIIRHGWLTGGEGAGHEVVRYPRRPHLQLQIPWFVDGT